MKSRALTGPALVAFSALLPRVAEAGNQCADIWRTVGSLVPEVIAVGTGPEIAAEGGCLVTGLRIGGQRQYAVLATIDRLWWSDGLPTGDRSGPLAIPETLELGIDGLRIGVFVDDPVWNYLMEAQRQAAGIDIRLAARWSPETQILDLDFMKVDFPGDNVLLASGTLTDLDPADFGAGARLTGLDLSVTTNGLFETYLLMPIGQALLAGSTDPTADVAAIKARASAAVAAAPIPDAASRAALIRLIEDMPNPSGTVELTLLSDNGFGLTAFAPFVSGLPPAWTAVSGLIDGARLTVSYAPGTDAPG